MGGFFGWLWLRFPVKLVPAFILHPSDFFLLTLLRRCVMKRILILGGGFGGLATAHALRRLRPDDEVIVVDRASHFMVGFRKTWLLLGEKQDSGGVRPLSSITRFGIRHRAGTVTQIDPENRAAEVDGERIEADALVVALGAQLAPETIPGLAEHGHNIYDPRLIPQARAALESFGGGHLAVGVFGAAYKCPPAPYEIAILVKEKLAQQGAAATMEVFTPLPMSLPILGDAGCNVIEGRLAENGIAFVPGHVATAVTENAVMFGDKQRPFDLLLAIPPHRCPAVVVESGLTGDRAWVPVNPRTLETDFSGVYAIGDVAEIPMANGKPLPKAGVFAEAEGQVVAQQIAATFAGETTVAAFAGNGGCFLEVGGGQALMVEGGFMAEPFPQVRLTEPSTDYLQQKADFEAKRLQEWFGE
jgi:sulfide:quinone oxidoreductase